MLTRYLAVSTDVLIVTVRRKLLPEHVVSDRKKKADNETVTVRY